MGATRLALLPSATQTATASSGQFNVPNAKELSVVVDVTAQSSGTNLTVWLEGSEDGGTTWAPLTADAVIQDATPAATSGTVTTNVRNIVSLGGATGRAHAKYTIFSDTIRVRWFLTGTSYTFSVRGVVK